MVKNASSEGVHEEQDAICARAPAQHSDPLKLEAWKRELKGYPDQPLAELITQGIANGFHIGYEADRAPLQAREGNMISAAQHPEVVSMYYLAEELEAGRVIKVGSQQEAKEIGIYCSPFGVISKWGRSGKWRLIVNLSVPEGKSMNDGISKERTVQGLGKGALMAKMDIKQAYCIIRKTGSCSAWNGKARSTWMLRSPLASGQPP